MKIQIENLRAQMRGVQLSSYQRALAMNEYYKLLDYVEKLEQLTIPAVSNCYMADCLIQDSCMSFKTERCNKECKLYM